MELLLTIALLAILALLLVPAMGALRGRADQMSCMSNLKTIWSGVLMYTQDNSGMLPYCHGAYFDSRFTAKSVANPVALPHHLAPYFVEDARTMTGSRYLEPFLCRAALRLMSDEQFATKRVCYQQAPTVLPDGTRVPNPFGLVQDGIPAVRLNTLQYPAKTIAVFDRGSTSATYQKVPTNAHGSHRNFLFFDGHISAIHTSQWGPANGQIRY